MPSFCPEANRIKKDERSLILLVLAWSVGQVRAADISWNTGNGTWNTLELNWTGDTNRFTDGGVDNVSFLGSGGGTVTVDIGMTPLSTIVDNDSGTYAFQGVAGSIDGGSLTKDGSGELELNTAHLMTNVTFVLHAGLLDLNTVQQVDSFSGTGGLLQYQGAGLIIGSNHTDTHWQGSTAGNGFLTKVGTGVFTFSGIGANNSFSAGLNISEGTFRIGAPNRIADATSVFITGRGILDLNGFDETVRQLRLEGGCTIRGNGGCLTLTQASRPFGGISGGASDLALVASDVHFSAGDPILLDVRNNDLGDGITQVFDGDSMWEKLVRKHKNIFLVMSGHICRDSRNNWKFDTNYTETGLLTSRGDHGNDVHQILADYQSRPNGGDGFLRLMRFTPEKNEIDVKTYSPFKDEWLTRPHNQFTLPYSMT